MELLVLPDTSEAEELAGAADARLVRHDSGRPWLRGRWADEDLTLIVAGSRRLAIFGRTEFDPAVARRALAAARSGHDLDALARSVPGSTHFFASINGSLRCQGDVSTARQVFHATVAGVTFAADSPRPLLALTGARVDEETLALRMLIPVTPWPLSLRTMWSGVRQVAAGHWLDVDGRGRHREVRWWSPPPAERTMARAAEEVRVALGEAVRVRTRRIGSVASDLSGGLDSTTLCFLADAVGANLVTHHWKPHDQANEDTRWAEHAAKALPKARHRFRELDQAPSWFEAGPESASDIEGPPSWHRNRAHMAAFTETDVAEGASIHLMGLGGDELFSPMPATMWSLARKRPAAAVPVIRRYRLMNRWGAAETLRALADTTDFARSLRDAADLLTAPPSPPYAVQLGWRGDLRLPPWATPDAVATVARLLREAAYDQPRPLDPDRARHQVLEFVTHSGAAIRQLRMAFQDQGVEWAAPFLDDPVIEAALSVRVEDRVPRGRYKPLLTTAMRGLVPDEILDRRSKGEYSAEVYDGLERNRAALTESCEDLDLARRGLVDAGRLRRSLLTLGPDTEHIAIFENTLACETWLRSPSVAAATTGGVS
ncbi:asparagine synthase-related protein [Amycolatopsis sp. NPDC059021]|uniref:asparagine synthase-related protein n=1 Tax=Amycolatopsis sp. NPDC059021 TaxID=3346704 RepID=UPI00366A6352